MTTHTDCSAAGLGFFTDAIFNTLAPSAVSPPYSYSGLCTAIKGWNDDVANAGNQIFPGTEAAKRAELAAFLGHTLHESGDFVYPRELSQCQDVADDAGTLHCQPPGYTNGDPAWANHYCSASHTSASNPPGCDCAATVPNNAGFGYEANAQFFGRGPMQLSWNYNYKAAGDALGLDLCTNPDQVATDPTVAWQTAIWFWMTSSGAINNGPTCHDYVTDSGSFGGSLFVINGGLECTASPSSPGSIVSRLNNYCEAANALGAGLLGFGDCTNLQTVFDSCVAGGTCTACNGITPAPTPVPTTGQPTEPPTSPPTQSPTTPAPTPVPTTGQPSKSPTPPPTQSPTTPVPTEAPTTSQPTQPPTPSPTQSPTQAPTTQVIVPGTLTFAPADCTANWEGQEAALKSIIEGVACAGSNDRIKTCTVEILSVTCIDTARLRRRGLQTSTLEVTYRVVIDAICSLSGCDGNAQGIQAVADAVYDGVVADLNAAINTFVTALGAASTDLAAVLTSAVVTGDFDPVLAPVLEFLSDFYPDWSGGSGTCKNDNQAPAYMKLTGIWYESSLEACCERFYGWDVFTCLGNSGADTSGLATNMWRVNYEDLTCVQDCPESSGTSCGGHANSWETLFDSAEDCCEGKLWWANQAACIGESTGTAVTVSGSEEWYVSWETGGKCVKDCPVGAANCGGLAESWENLYSSADQCCERLWWIGREDCTY